MPIRSLKLSQIEAREYHARLLRLEAMGISIEGPALPAPEPDRFTLEPIQHEYARFYELPFGAVAVVAPAKLTVLTSNTLITDVEMAVPWDGSPLDLSEPEENYYHRDLMATLPFLPKVLNRLLAPSVPLRPRQVEGVVVGHGWSVVPPECHDESLVKMTLSLRDGRRNEYRFEFGVLVDRSISRQYERLRQRAAARTTRSAGLFAPAGRSVDCSNASPKRAIKHSHAADDASD